MRAIVITLLALTAGTAPLSAQEQRVPRKSKETTAVPLRPPIELPPFPTTTDTRVAEESNVSPPVRVKAAPAPGSYEYEPPEPLMPVSRSAAAASHSTTSAFHNVPMVKLSFGDCKQEELVSSYVDRAQQIIDDDELGVQSVSEFPMDYQPWWSQEIGSSLRSRYVPMEITLEEVIISALNYSPRVKALRLEPSIKHRSVAIERAQFDWLSFAEMNWDDTSDPVGNDLTTGGSPRFRDHRWGLEAGLRRRTHSGGELEITNDVGWQDNNSNFFTPAPQGTSRLEVSFTQPLLRARGRFYNKSRIVLAQIDTSVADSETLVKIQDHLIEVSQAYWELFRSRASLLQKKKLLSRATVILDRLEGRRGVDVLERQILRARSAVASRRSEIARAGASVRNAESRLRLLVNDPSLLTGTPLELIPGDAPLCENMVYSTPETVTVGLLTRPDIARAIRKIRAQSVRLGVSKAEMLPKLDLILSSYLAGLEDKGDIWGARRKWFEEGEPGYSIGFKFEYPLGNRAARALVEQQQFRLRKAMFEFRNTVETGITEVELAVREARTSHTEMLSRFQAMRAAEAESIYLSERWQRLPGDDRTTAELLEDLLDAQQRVATEEYSFETARMNYMLALIEIKRSTGTLLAAEDGQNLLSRSSTMVGPIESHAAETSSQQYGRGSVIQPGPPTYEHRTTAPGSFQRSDVGVPPTPGVSPLPPSPPR